MGWVDRTTHHESRSLYRGQSMSSPPLSYKSKRRPRWTDPTLVGTGRFLSQQELHTAIAGTLRSNSGNIHVKTSPHWDLGTAIRYTESLGYKGLYSIEVNPEAAIGIVYNTIIANL